MIMDPHRQTELDELGPRNAEERARWTRHAKILIAVVWLFVASFSAFLLWMLFR